MKRCPDARSIPRLLCETLAVKHYADNTWSGILVDFLYYNILFCEEKGLSPEKTSAFFTIMKRVFEFTFRPELEPGNVDDDVERVGVDASFAFFKEQMLRHSVEAPAEGSVGLFTVADVEFIAEFISTTRVRRRRSSCSVFRNVPPRRRFYRHFKAYSYCFYNKQPDENVERTLVVETPLPPPPLAEATTDATNELAEPPAPAPVRAPVAEGLVDAE